MDPVNRSHIQTAGRLIEHHQALPEIDFTSQNNFLLVAAGKASGNVIRSRSLDRVLLDDFVCIFIQCLLADESVLYPLRIETRFQQYVLRQRHIHFHRIAVTVHRDIAYS